MTVIYTAALVALVVTLAGVVYSIRRALRVIREVASVSQEMSV